MAHHIQAIIGAVEVIARAADLGLDDAPIALESGLARIPVRAGALDGLAERSALPIADWDERFMYLGSVVPALLATLSRHGPVAYVETEYFGGVGTQVATVYDHGERTVECATVNEALRALGVRARDGLDGWATVGLQHHRGMPGARAAQAEN